MSMTLDTLIHTRECDNTSTFGYVCTCSLEKTPLLSNSYPYAYEYASTKHELLMAGIKLAKYRSIRLKRLYCYNVNTGNIILYTSVKKYQDYSIIDRYVCGNNSTYLYSCALQTLARDNFFKKNL